MTNLIYANSEQNYFQCRGSHYKYEKGVPLGLPISRSIFKNFLQNLEGKFIKSSSKSKASIHYSTECLRSTVHLTYLFCPTHTVWIRQIPVEIPHGTHRASCVFTSSAAPSMEFMVLRDAGITNDNSQCRAGAQAVIRCAQVGTTWSP